MKKSKPTSLAEAIDQHKATQLSRKERASKLHQNQVSLYGDYVHERMLLAKSNPTALTEDGPNQLKKLYYDLRTQFYSSFSLVPSVPNQRSKDLWEKVHSCQQRAGVSSKTYMEAQFSYFEKHFKTVPSLKHLLTLNAVQRAQDFAKNGNKFSPGVAYKVEGTDRAELLRATDETIRAMCKTRGISKCEFYLQFVLTGFFPLPDTYTSLDPEFSKAKSTWQATQK